MTSAERAAWDHPVRARFAILAAAVLFSSGGAAIKATSLTGWQVASFRSGIAALAVLAMLPSARRGWGIRPLVVGVGYAATMICFVLANKLTTSANTIYLQSTAPIYLVLVGPLVLGEQIRRREIAFMAVLVVGLALFFIGREPVRVTAPHPLQGNLIALLSGIFWAFTIAGLRYIGRSGGPAGGAAASVVLGNLIACVAALPLALPVDHLALRDVAVVGFLGVFQIGLAYVFLTAGIAHVGALEASLLLLAEPVLNPLWAWLVHGERPTAWSAAGGIVIVAATVAKTLYDARTSTASEGRLAG